MGDDVKKTNAKDALASAIVKAHRSAIKSYEKSSASFARQADALRPEGKDASSAKADKMIRALEKLSAACLAKAAEHERKIEKRAS